MLRMLAVASLTLLSASPMPKAAAFAPVAATAITPIAGAPIATAPIERAVFHGGPSARDAMNESIAHVAVQAATPGADATALSQRDRLALLVLLSLHHGGGAASR